MSKNARIKLLMNDKEINVFLMLCQRLKFNNA